MYVTACIPPLRSGCFAVSGANGLSNTRSPTVKGTVSTSEIARSYVHFCRPACVCANFLSLCGHGHDDVAGIFCSMSAPYDPNDALYLDEADVRLEIARSLNVCQGCRLCVDLCSVFPSAFSLIEHLPSSDAAMMTPHQQDTIIEACHECTLCTARCPYSPGKSGREKPGGALDVWGLMVRAKRMRRHHGLLPVRQRVREWLGALLGTSGAKR